MIEARWLYDPEVASWNPNLYVKNALGDVKQEVASQFVNNQDEPVLVDTDEHDIIYVWEIRKVVGTFWEKLELNSFPADVQQLSLQIVSRHPIEECVLVENRFQPSMVNREAFLGTRTSHVSSTASASSSSSTGMVSLRTHRNTFDHQQRRVHLSAHPAIDISR